jgi:CubicO group peptidase (beta-lactamase class C family)
MRHKLLGPVAAGLCCVLFLARAIATEVHAEKMDQIVQSYVDARQFMGVVLVARGDDILFGNAYGSANLEWKTPNTTTTKFRIGSITKQFTAASVLLLEERGKLALDEPVRTYYPDAPAAWKDVTLFHLLTHTSGIPNYDKAMDYPAVRKAGATPEQLVRHLLDDALEFAPGTAMRYSNSGYALLGYIIEKTSGVSYAQFVERNLLAPLGMKDSGYDSASTLIERRAAGHEFTAGGPVNASFVDMSVPYAAGALYSTTEDLLRWERALFGGRVLSPPSMKKMLSPTPHGYALGLIVRRQFGRELIEHGGNIAGFSSQMNFYPESQVTIIVLSNLRTSAAKRMTAKLGALMHGEPVALGAAAEREAAEL